MRSCWCWARRALQIAGDGLEANGQEQGMNIFGRGPLAKGSVYSVSVSGTAPAPNVRGGGDSDSGGQQQGQDAAAAGQVTVTQIPGRLDVLKWPLVVGFLGLFALGAIFLARKPVAVVAGVGGVEIPVAPSSAAKKVAASASANKIAAAPSIADVDAAVGTSLDSLKDQIFRLELRRQAGTISEEEYAQERARAEKVLRDLVRG